VISKCWSINFSLERFVVKLPLENGSIERLNVQNVTVHWSEKLLISCQNLKHMKMRISHDILNNTECKFDELKTLDITSLNSPLIPFEDILSRLSEDIEVIIANRFTLSQNIWAQLSTFHKLRVLKFDYYIGTEVVCFFFRTIKGNLMKHKTKQINLEFKRIKYCNIFTS